MSQYLKGNYKLEVKIEEAQAAADSTDAFERTALARLGGSICFVSKKAFVWKGPAKAERPEKPER
ncbi:MAG: hypothetical protein DMD91_19780 [Candidatus Rokuibacteriota bacterium]|nr:MAG: hypothetical protein DMD91_19780 [Candidatus Rokubacteria bacterium]